MILQYQGFKNNWCYTEAETIVLATVWVGKETRDYRKGGCHHNKHIEDREKCHGKEIADLDLKYAQEMHKAVNKLIKEETNCNDKIIYIINGRFDEMENVSVVTLQRPERAYTYVFSGIGGYILNNSGKTVQKIAA